MPSTNGHGSSEATERVAVYLRVSSEEQRDAGTIKTQREFLDGTSERSGFEVVKVYADDGVSGVIPLHERPEGRRLLQDAKDGEFDTVLVYKLDRLSRTQLGLLDAADRLERAGVALRSATEHYETATPQGRLLFQMLGSFAEFERASIKERTRDGLHRLYRNGRHTGAIPYGYTVPENGLLEVVPEQALVVTRIFENIAAGATLYSDVRRLNDTGVPAPGLRYRSGRSRKPPAGGWREPTVHDLLHRRAYSGVHVVRINQGRDSIERAIPAIISEELQERALKTLKENKRYSGGRAHRNYLLSGLITCEVCGCSCTGRTSTAKSHRYAYYRCTDDHPSRGLRAPRGHSPNVPAEWLEETVWADVRRFLKDPGKVLARLRSKHEEDDATEELESRREDLSRRLAEKHKERERYIRLCARGSITEPELDSYLAGIRTETENLRMLLESVEAGIETAREQRELAATTEAWLVRLRERLEEVEADTPEAYQKRRRLVKLLVAGITAGRDAEGALDVRITYRFGPPKCQR